MLAVVAAGRGLVLESRDLEKVEDVEIEPYSFSIGNVEEVGGQMYLAVPGVTVRVYRPEGVPCASLS